MTLTPEHWASCGFSFWAGLEWTDNGLGILEACEDVFSRDRVFLCTSPCLTAGGLEGKRQWVFNHLPAGYAERLIFCKQKSLLAGNGILVDDYEKNVDEFRIANGKAVLVPRLWNRRRAWAQAPETFPRTLKVELHKLLKP